MKRLVKAALSRMGIIAFKRSTRIYLAENESYRVAASLCGRPDPVIIDGGAHRGDTVEAFSRLFPSAEFHCFEPDPELNEELSRTYSGRGNVHIVKAALGESSRIAKFNVNAFRPSNSLLQPAKDIQPDLGDLLRPVRQIEVDVTTIDEYRTARNLKRVDIIKLDLQGYDYKALQGAGSTLPGVSVVLVEALFAEIYQGCHLFPDILRLALEHGFNLYTLSGLHYGVGDELLWADAIFVNSGLRGRGIPQSPAQSL